MHVNAWNKVWKEGFKPNKEWLPLGKQGREGPRID